ncbi:putative reverse transcriptase domain-containing protein [Tanacetum coccineum]
MAAPVISISSDLSDESVGSSIPRVILIGSISVEVPVALEVGAAAVASPTGVRELDTHSSSEADPSKSLLPLISVAPMVSVFLWRSKVASRSSSPTTSTLEIPTAPTPPAPSAIVAPSIDIISPVNAPHVIRRRRAILIRPGQDIPIDRLYRTHPGGQCRALKTRKSVRPLPSYRLALRYTSHHLDRFTSGSSSDHSYLDHSSSRHSTSNHSSSGHSTSDHSSSGHSTSGHSLSGHTPPVTTIDDSSTPSRFVYLPLVRTSKYSEAYRRWRSAPLSTMYPLTTSESSSGDSSSKSSAIPSRKRYRSPAATVTASIPTLGALVPSRVDLLPPRKRFRDFISPEDSVKEDIDTDMLADIEADATAVEVATDMDIEAGIDACIGIEVDVGVDIEDEVEGEVKSSDRGTMEVGVDVVVGIDNSDDMLMPDVVECLEQVEEVVQNIYGHVMEIPLQRVEDIESGQIELEARSLISSGESATLLDYALAVYEANNAAELAVESQSHNGDDDDNGNGEGNGNEAGGGNGDGNGGGFGNENRGGNRNGNPNRNDRGAIHVARECTYHDFMKCQPLNFKGTEGVVGLTRWFEKMETMFHISNYPERYQVRYGTCTLLNNALTWWNAHKRTIRADVAFSMSWRERVKLMTEVYCPRNEIQKMEYELWNLIVKNNDFAAYTQRFQELTMMCTKMVLEEEDRVEKFIGGLPDNIQGNVIAAEPTRLQDAIRIANNLMDQKLKGYAEEKKAG